MDLPLGDGAGLTDSLGDGAGLTDSLGDGAGLTDSPGETAELTDSPGETTELTDSPGEAAGTRRALPTALGSPRPVLSGPATGASRWPVRRTVATALLSPAVLALFVSAGGGWTLDVPLWAVLTLATSVVGAAALASYLPRPGHGWHADVGCTPCAAVSAGTLLGAAWLLGGSPHQASMAATALGLVAIGLYQRLTGSGTSCAT